MTARLPEEPMRVTSWLAGWLDYVFAIVLVASRWLRLPVARPVDEPVMLSAFAPAMSDQYSPRWNESAPRQQSGAFIRVAEIVMLSISFFLAAHLLSGGTPTVAAPDLGAFGLLSERAHAETLPVPSAASKLVEVPAGSFAQQPAANSTETAAASTRDEEAALLAEPAAADTAAASVQEAAPVPPAAVELPAPAPAPPAPVATVAANLPTLPDRYLTAEEIRSAALAAGWPAAIIPQLERVAWCESRYHTHAQYLGALGLMQLLPFWFDVAGLDRAMWADPVVNLKAAYVAYIEHERAFGDPWHAWTCKP
ncbi:MAG: lytic transglycosylase domain-containing protein [Dehalococcoidia bacterium]|nr:lytic transglycosylase domain-containing protein [Dehalococcoidia bacterium]